MKSYSSLCSLRDSASSAMEWVRFCMVTMPTNQAEAFGADAAEDGGERLAPLGDLEAAAHDALHVAVAATQGVEDSLAGDDAD